MVVRALPVPTPRPTPTATPTAMTTSRKRKMRRVSAVEGNANKKRKLDENSEELTVVNASKGMDGSAFLLASEPKSSLALAVGPPPAKVMERSFLCPSLHTVTPRPSTAELPSCCVDCSDAPFQLGRETGDAVPTALDAASDDVTSSEDDEPCYQEEEDEQEKDARARVVEEDPLFFEFTPIVETKQRSLSSSLTSVPVWMAVVLSLALLLLFFTAHDVPSLVRNRSAVTAEKDSVCVSGGGFSGFWFTLGRLDSIPHPETKTYYCYSAGCLGLVAALSHLTMEQTYEIARDKQLRWQRGDISRYDVVGAFVDDLLATASNSTKGEFIGNSPDLLRRLNILTTVPRSDSWFGVEPSIRTATDLETLRSMLIQTTWIPYAVGGDLWSDSHMDGAFSLAHHPPCEHRVGLAMDADLIMNVVNVNLGREKVEKLWRKGLEYGL
jgi:hypothetical protein